MEETSVKKKEARQTEKIKFTFSLDAELADKFIRYLFWEDKDKSEVVEELLQQFLHDKECKPIPELR